MPEKSLKEIPRNLREQYEKGMTAFQRHNFDYAMTIFNQLLIQEPAFYDCREALRATQFKKAQAGSSFFRKVLGGANSSSLVAKGQITLRRNPNEAVQIAEQILNTDPNSGAAHRLLADAALAIHLPKTAILSLEILVKNSPDEASLSRALGDAYALTGDVTKAEQIYSDLLEKNPNDPEIAQALKNLSARKTMSEGGYESLADGTGSYRNILRNKDEAVSLEQQHRGVKTDSVLDRLIAEAEIRLAEEPRNLKTLRTLAELNIQRKSFDRAIEIYQQMSALSDGTDPAIERAMVETKVRKLEAAMEELDRSLPDYELTRRKLDEERNIFLLQEAKQRSDRYPNDLQLRYELGQLYLAAGKLGEAIGELQKSQNHPNRRVQSMNLLGQAFSQRGMFDLAARTFLNALKEKPVFDDEKKELIYYYGLTLEKMGKGEEAVDQFKQVYEVDIGYRDVAAKVDAFYAGN